MAEQLTRTVVNPRDRVDTPTQELASMLNQRILETKDRLAADRVSIFFFDRDKCELWSVLSQEQKIMRLDARLGIAGHVAMTGETVNVANAYEHPLFYTNVDVEIGYRTETLLAVPLKNPEGTIIGVGEAVNKARGLFTNEDAGVLQRLAEEVSGGLAEFVRQMIDYPSSPDHFPTQRIVGMSHRIEAIIRLIDQIRNCSVDVLIQGESGTGKELVARALHESSPRAGKPFIAVNCAALADDLMESELLGIEGNVATGVKARPGHFESANGGTLFLDEIGDLVLPAQAKILRVLQEREVVRVGSSKPIPIDVRVLAATNKDLESAIKERNFREDLYYRLKVISIQTPPLREVPEDIPQMANHFLAKHCRLLKQEPKEFAPNAMQALMRSHWKGNSRQLENEIKRLIASVRGKIILEEHLEPSIRLPQPVPGVTDAAPSAESPKETQSAITQTLPEAVEALERRMTEHALRVCAGNKQKAAQMLGVSRQGLIKKLKRWGTV